MLGIQPRLTRPGLDGLEVELGALGIWDKHPANREILSVLVLMCNFVTYYFFWLVKYELGDSVWIMMLGFRMSYLNI